MRLAVPRQEILEPQEIAVVGRTDQDRAAGVRRDQGDAAQDQRAHDALAELGLGDQHGAELVGRDEDHLDLAFGMAVDQRRLAGQLADLGEELAGALVDQPATWPSPSCWVIATWPERMTNMPGPGLPVSNSASPSVAAHRRRISAGDRSPAASARGKVCS